MDENNSELYRRDYRAWVEWKLAQPGKYATEEAAKDAADTENHTRLTTEFTYGVTENPNGGWDVCSYSSAD